MDVRLSGRFDPQESCKLRLAAISAAKSVEVQLKTAFRANMEIEFKSDRRDIVTAYDKLAEKAICKHLLASVPDSSFVGEEGGDWGSGRIKWFIDPIDGTANFARGLPNWCISIGAVSEDRIIAGVIVDPIGCNVFSADLIGAYHNNTNLKSTGILDEKLSTILCSYPSARDLIKDGSNTALARFGELVETFSAVRRIGSAALNLAYVAAGWADGAANFSVNAWDITAGILILRQAGGHFLPLDMGITAKDTPDYRHSGYVALANGASCPKLISIAMEIASQRRESKV